MRSHTRTGCWRNALPMAHHAGRSYRLIRPEIVRPTLGVQLCKLLTDTDNRGRSSDRSESECAGKEDILRCAHGANERETRSGESCRRWETLWSVVVANLRSRNIKRARKTFICASTLPLGCPVPQCTPSQYGNPRGLHLDISVQTAVLNIGHPAGYCSIDGV